MQIGIHVNRFTWPGNPEALAPTLASIARRAEEAGFFSLSVMDHFFQIAHNGPPNLEMLEAYTALGYVAGVTSKLRLGTIVTGVTYRHPGILVKQVTTLDVLSGGRAYFGVGAAWNEEEHVGLGVPFPPLKERFERLEETLQIAKQMWAGDERPFVGKHYRLERPLCSPPALQKPHPTIVVGGSGERKTLRLVAKYADACNLQGGSLQDPAALELLRHKLEVLREHCEAVGRPYDQIVKGMNSRLRISRDGKDDTQTPAQVVERFAALRELGITWVNCSIPNAHEPGVLELIGSEVVPKISRL